MTDGLSRGWGHPQPPTQVPPPRHSHDGHPRAHGAMIEGPPRHCIPLQWRPPSSPTPLPPGTAGATPRGEPAASPPHRALTPGHSHRIPCSSSALPGCMGEDLSPAQDPRQGRFQAISDMCGTAHQYRVFRMIPGIRSPTNRKKRFSLGFQTCTHCQNPKRLAVGKRGAGGYPLGLLGKVFWFSVISPA